MNINRWIGIGNLTRDPELRHTQGGTAVCDLRIAINGREKVNGEWTDRADFFDVTVWGNQAEACAQYLSKGSLTGVDGHLRFEEWEDRETAAKRSRVKIVADVVQFLDTRSGSNQAHEQGDPPARDDIGF